jgi:hypothetical protein
LKQLRASAPHANCALALAAWFCKLLTAADCDYDFYAIAIGKLLLIELAARHNLPIALQRHALVPELQAGDELGGGERGLEAAGLTVDGEGNHGSREKN